MPHVCRALLTVGLGVAAAAAAAAQERTFRQTMEFQSGSRLALEADRGSVRLTSWDRPSAEIVARIEPPSGVDADYARRAVDGAAIEVRGNRRSVRIRTDYRGVPRGGLFGNRRLPRVHYEIRVPRELDLDLEVDRAATTLEGFEGRLLLDLDRSDLDLRDVGGALTLQFDRGRLQASGLAGSIAIRLDRAGEVVLDGARGDLRLDADRTDVVLRDLDVEGDSVVEMDRGDLDVELAADGAVTVDVSTTRRSGFSSDLPATFEPRGGGFRGDVNGGGPVLRIQADRGAVRVRMHQESAR